jgi:hypothetical protein
MRLRPRSLGRQSIWRRAPARVERCSAGARCARERLRLGLGLAYGLGRHDNDAPLPIVYYVSA